MSKMRELRLAKGMTLQQVANKAGRAIATVVDAETGSQNPRVNTARAIAKALGATLNDVWAEDPASASTHPA